MRAHLSLRNALLVLVAWLVLGYALATQIIIDFGPTGARLGYIGTLPSQLARVLCWFLAVPLALWLHRQMPLSGPRRAAAFWAHVAISFFLPIPIYLLRLYVAFVMEDVQAGLFTWGTLYYDGYWAFAGITFSARVFSEAVLYWALIVFARLREADRARAALEVAQAELRTQVTEAELRALKQRLQPHFLFNALNSVAMLVRAKQEDKAVETLAQISALLRMLIDNSRQPLVPLSRELDFTQRYLEIEQVRFGPQLKVSYAIDDCCLDHPVPGLLLQPLVENAIKHGIARRLAPGAVSISARRSGARLRLEVANDAAEDAAPPADGVNVGIETTCERLRRTYGDDFQLISRFNQAGRSVVQVDLPFQDTRS